MRRIENVRLVMTEIMIWLAAIALLIAGLGIQYSWNSQVTGRMSPSWAQDATILPPWKSRPEANPRACEAEGEIMSYSNHSSAINRR